MEKKKIQFIIHTKEKNLTEECIYYISKLHVPDGVEVGLVTVSDTVDRAGAYSEADQSSDAEYRIFVDEMVCFMDENFLEGMLRFYQERPTVKVIGMLADGWEAEKEGVASGSVISVHGSLNWTSEMFDTDTVDFYQNRELAEQKELLRLIDGHMLGIVWGGKKRKQNETPFVSILLCTYNGEAHIKATIESVLNQSYRNFELIIVDDASTDSTVKVISEYADARISLICLRENQHICNASNVAFHSARGKYVAQLGHDDIWESGKIQAQVQFMECHPEFGACFTWADIVDENLDIVNEKYESLANRFHEHNYSRKEWIHKLLIGGNFFCGPSGFLRMDILKKTGYYRYGLVQLQDYDLWLRMLMHAPIYLLPETFTKYRRFADESRHISGESPKVTRRRINETHFIVDSFISQISVEQYRTVFREQLCNPNAETEAEILCEKVLLRLRYGNGMGNFRMMELLEDDMCRQLLHDVYGISLTDFYATNTREIFFSIDAEKKVLEQEELLEAYRKANQKLKKMLLEKGYKED